MTENSLISIVVGTIIFMGIGNFAAGYAGDMAIEEISTVFDQCKTNPEKFWKDYCFQIEETFDKTIKMEKSAKELNQILGLIIPFIVGGIALVKKLS